MTETSEDVLSDKGLVAIGSATGTGGLHARLKEHISNPTRLERAARECRCGWRNLVVCWAETPDPQTAIAYEEAMRRARLARRLHAPVMTTLQVLETVRELPTDDELGALEWSGLHALPSVEAPGSFGIYAITVVRPEEPEYLDPIAGKMELVVCPFSGGEPSCDRRANTAPKVPKRPTHTPDGRPIIYGHPDDHDWIQQLRRARLEAERIEGRELTYDNPHDSNLIGRQLRRMRLERERARLRASRMEERGPAQPTDNDASNLIDRQLRRMRLERERASLRASRVEERGPAQPTDNADRPLHPNIFPWIDPNESEAEFKKRARKALEPFRPIDNKDRPWHPNGFR